MWVTVEKEAEKIQSLTRFEPRPPRSWLGAYIIWAATPKVGILDKKQTEELIKQDSMFKGILTVATEQKLNLCHKNITDSMKFKFGSKGQIYVHFNSTHRQELNIAKFIANKQHPTSGYDDDFLKAVDQDCKYPICHLPLREPFQRGMTTDAAKNVLTSVLKVRVYEKQFSQLFFSTHNLNILYLWNFCRKVELWHYDFIQSFISNFVMIFSLTRHRRKHWLTRLHCGGNKSLLIISYANFLTVFWQFSDDSNYLSSCHKEMITARICSL